jgi:tight adherence protein C
MYSLINKLRYLLVQNADQGIILGLIFLAVALLAGGIALLFLRRDTASGRLEKMMQPAGASPSKPPPKLLEKESSGLVKKISDPMHTLLTPTDALDKASFKRNMVQAGLRSRRAYRGFLTAKALLSVFLPLGYLIGCSIYKFTIESISISLILFAGGFFVPDIIILQMKQKRQISIVRALPDALDLMVICVTAGLGLDMTFNRVGSEMRSHSKDLSDEFHLTNLEIKAGASRQESYKNMAERTGVNEVKSLMSMLIQTSRFGTSIADALRIHSDAMRVKRRQMAEEIAAKSAVKLILPLIAFIFPALMIVLGGPAAIKVFLNLLPALRGQ